MKVFVALPAYGGVNVCACTMSLFNAAVAMTRHGIEATMATFTGPDIAVLRNAILSLFFYRMDATHLLFVDSDMKFPPELIIDMLRFNEPLTGLIYPAKMLPLRFVVSGLPQTEARGGFLKEKSIGFGVTMVRRDCVQRLIDHSPSIVRMIADMPPSFEREILETYGLNCLVAAFDRLPGKSEDVSFCERWRAAGGTVWANVIHKVGHVGQFAFEGRFLDQLSLEEQDRVSTAARPNA